MKQQKGQYKKIAQELYTTIKGLDGYGEDIVVGAIEDWCEELFKVVTERAIKRTNEEIEKKFGLTTEQLGKAVAFFGEITEK